MQYLSAQNKGLLTQLSEAKRRQAEIECKVNKSTARFFCQYKMPFLVLSHHRLHYLKTK